MVKKTCQYCGEVQDVKKSKSKQNVLDAMWGGDVYAFRCKNCGLINYDHTFL